MGLRPRNGSRTRGAQESMYLLRDMSCDGAPTSGTTGTLAGYVEPGGFLFDKTNGVLFHNEGTKDSPYYTPVNFNQRGLFGVWSDFRDTVGKAHADTAAAAFLGGSGVRVFGDDVTQTDSGLVANAAGEGGRTTRMTTTATTAKLIALGTDAGVMQPDQHQLLVIDVKVAMVTALTARSMFCGFLGLAADTLVPAATGSTTTITLVQDDLAGLLMDAGLTAATGLMAPHNKSDEAATIATTATGVNTGTVVPAAGTYVRLRVEIDASGVMRCFRDKVEITKITAALDVDEECSPVLYVESRASAVKAMDVAHFASWAYR